MQFSLFARYLLWSICIQWMWFIEIWSQIICWFLVTVISRFLLVIFSYYWIIIFTSRNILQLYLCIFLCVWLPLKHQEVSTKSRHCQKLDMLSKLRFLNTFERASGLLREICDMPKILFNFNQDASLLWRFAKECWSWRKKNK